ncbi:MULTISPECIES: helix-turn-helix domain-containing protein [Clostridium]|uniref:helix-turn-helix domain-containing protein n=1 Tax=Clostridium TaxID=1485 RepID=UPI0009BC94D7|nr:MULTISPECIES: helix-turn-helix transcriptional regulator [Clostridium]PJI08133.1 XRE family transcriptional regulator [Clostridium sp. CT7]
MSLGEKIQSLRKQNNLSQEQLAEKLMVSRQSVSKWELDQSIPDVHKIIEISNLFEVTTDYLLREDMKVPMEQIVEDTVSSAYRQFIGRWVKIFLDDRGFGGLYQVAVLDVNNDYILFQNRKGKKGILTAKSIISISDADVYKKSSDKIPEIVLRDVTEINFFEYFKGKHCTVHFICKSMFAGPQGCFDALVKEITDDEILIINRKRNSVIKIERILMMVER